MNELAGITRHMSNRIKVPQAKETELLTLSARRCCLCFAINNDYNEKAGQIVHLDQDPSNNDIDNLAWLCLEHHDKYDGKTSQSKGYQEHEVKTYRKKLYDTVSELRKSAFTDTKQKITSTNNFQPTQTNIKTEIRKLLNHINPQVLTLVDSEHQAISVMISMPKLSMLQELTTDPYFSEYLRIQPTGSVNIGFNNRIGNAINDINEGFLQGYVLYPTDKLKK